MLCAGPGQLPDMTPMTGRKGRSGVIGHGSNAELAILPHMDRIAKGEGEKNRLFRPATGGSSFLLDFLAGLPTLIMTGQQEEDNEQTINGYCTGS